MPAFQCAFCNHANPAGAKFCNACGSPLNLKPCAGCDAVNEEAAIACYKCGADLRSPPLTVPASPATATVAVPALAAGGEAEHKPLPESAADILAMLRGPPTPQAGRGGQRQTKVASRVPREWREHVLATLSTLRHPSSIAPSASGMAAAKRHATLRSALLTGVVLVALTVSAYYAYRRPAEIGNWLENRDRDTGSPGIQSRPQPSVGAASTSVAGGPLRPSSGSAAGASNEPSAPDSGHATRVASAQPGPESDTGAEARTSDAGDDATVQPSTLADAPAGTQAPVVLADIAAPATAAELSTTQPSARDGRPRPGARHAPINRLPAANVTTGVRAPLGEVGSRGSPRESPGIVRCTDAVAALGLCKPPVTGERP